MKAWLCGLILLVCGVAGAQNGEPKFSILSTNPVVLSKLWSAQNICLMTNAEFRRAFGAKLIFKGPDGIEAFKFDALHPSVLKALKLEPNTLLAQQQEIDERGRRLIDSYAAGVNAEMQRRQVAIDASEKAQAEQDRRDAIAKRQQFEDSLRTQAVENERIKAQASLIQAQNPAQLIIQQTQIGR